MPGRIQPIAFMAVPSHGHAHLPKGSRFDREVESELIGFGLGLDVTGIGVGIFAEFDPVGDLG